MSHRSLLIALSFVFAHSTIHSARENQRTNGSTDGTPAPVTVPATVRSEYLVFVHFKAKEIRDGALFTELKQAFTKAGGTVTEWDQIENGLGRELGVNPTDVDSVIGCLTESGEREVPKFVLILASKRAINKAGVFGLKPGTKPDARGFYTLAPGTFVHFPDDKAVALVHADLAQKYLDGYAKDRTGWPLTADLSRAAAGHTLFASLRLDKLPDAGRTSRELKEFGPLLAARAVTLTADLKGKELSIAARATFANAIAAGKARHKAHGLIGLVGDEVDKILADKAATELGPVRPALKEAERMLATAQIEVDGADLTARAKYTADFDFGVMMLAAVKQVREGAARTRAANNFKQAGLALHVLADSSNGRIPVHGLGPKGAPLKNVTDKPLLSWRVALLPYIEEGELYRQFKLDEPWDSEHNTKLIAKMPGMFAPVGKPGKAGYTHMQMVVGPNALPLPSVNLPASFPDGTSNTIAVVEAAEPVNWTKPDDVMVPEKELPKGFQKRLGGQFPGGFYVALWDGSVRFVPGTISDKTLGFALNPSDGNVLGSDW